MTGKIWDRIFADRRTEEELCQRIRAFRVASARMEDRDYMGRFWIAEMMADADIIADALAERLRMER